MKSGKDRNRMNRLLTVSGRQMKRLFTVSEKRGLPPGSMVYTGKHEAEPLRISVIDYNADVLNEQEDATPESCVALKDTDTISWINVVGLNDTKAISRIGTEFEIHPLVLEDILHTTQRPKLEDLGDYLFLVVRMLYVEPETGEIHSEQISFILTSHCLITFQEKAGDVFDEIRDRLRKSHGRIRKMGVDYLLYALMDAIVDNYFLIMEKTGEQIEADRKSVV